MKKRKYEEADMEIIVLDALSDVITTSGLVNGGENGVEDSDDFGEYWGDLN